MKNLFFTVGIISLVLSFASCGSKNKAEQQEEIVAIDAAHNSENSLDWVGAYEGTTPCADCEGIKMKVTLNEDGTCQVESQYIGKGDETFTDKGNFKWDETGSIVTLTSEDGRSTFIYKVGENTLTQLDLEGNPIESEFADMYILKKI